MTYTPNDYSRLMGTKGFSDEALETHLKLYEGYVKHTNKALELLNDDSLDAYARAEVRRRLGWEFNGMRLHEYYFENMTKDETELDEGSTLTKALERDFGSIESWKSDFQNTGSARGIGWAVLYADPQHGGRLMNTWIHEHDGGHPAGLQPILIMDVFEHAFIKDYGLDRASYIESFMNAADFRVMQKRYDRVSL